MKTTNDFTKVRISMEILHENTDSLYPLPLKFNLFAMATQLYLCYKHCATEGLNTATKPNQNHKPCKRAPLTLGDSSLAKYLPLYCAKFVLNMLICTLKCQKSTLNCFKNVKQVTQRKMSVLMETCGSKQTHLTNHFHHLQCTFVFKSHWLLNYLGYVAPYAVCSKGKGKKKVLPLKTTSANGFLL